MKWLFKSRNGLVFMVMKNIYKEQVELMYQCCREIEVDELQLSHCVWMVGTNNVLRQKELHDHLNEYDPEMFVGFIGQEGMLAKSRMTKEKFQQIVMWNDRYSSKMCEALDVEFGIQKPDVFCFYSPEVICVKSYNLYQISLSINKKWGCKICSYDAEGRVYIYSDLASLCSSMELYFSMKNYLTVVFSKKDNVMAE